jgi:hypothetical protein
MNLIYSDKVKFLKGKYQNEIGAYIDETSGAYLIKIDDSIVIIEKYNYSKFIEKI